MPRQDDDLLARLNALKPSSVTLQSSSPSIKVDVSQPQSVEDKLADRLKRLRGQDIPLRPVAEPYNAANSASSLTAQVTDEAATENGTFQDWHQQADGDEQTLDELIAELAESEADWKSNPDEPKHVEALLKEASAALPVDSETLSSHSKHIENQAVQPAALNTAQAVSTTEEQQDDEEIDEHVRRILAELEIDEKLGEQTPRESLQDEDNPSHSHLNLPSTPSSSLKPRSDPASSSEPPSYEDSELEARLSRLGMTLPSTPTNKPSSSKPRIQAALKPGPKGSNNSSSKLPSFTDEEIDSWCCICNSDGALRCLGCDGDIYCAECWHEGHGPKPGQERGHRAVAYAKPPQPKPQLQ